MSHGASPVATASVSQRRGFPPADDVEAVPRFPGLKLRELSLSVSGVKAVRGAERLPDDGVPWVQFVKKSPLEGCSFEILDYTFLRLFGKSFRSARRTGILDEGLIWSGSEVMVVIASKA